MTEKIYSEKEGKERNEGKTVKNLHRSRNSTAMETALRLVYIYSARERDKNNIREIYLIRDGLIEREREREREKMYISSTDIY